MPNIQDDNTNRKVLRQIGRFSPALRGAWRGAARRRWFCIGIAVAADLSSNPDFVGADGRRQTGQWGHFISDTAPLSTPFVLLQLHCCTVVVVGASWSPGPALQAEGRHACLACPACDDHATSDNQSFTKSTPRKTHHLEDILFDLVSTFSFAPLRPSINQL